MVTNLPSNVADQDKTVRNAPVVTTFTRRLGPSSPVPQERVPAITHAWSIGTTDMAVPKPMCREEGEECPPEVYIG